MPKPAHPKLFNNYQFLNFYHIQMAITNHNPYKKPELILEPCCWFHMVVLLIESAVRK